MFNGKDGTLFLHKPQQPLPDDFGMCISILDTTRTNELGSVQQTQNPCVYGSLTTSHDIQDK